MAALHTPDVLLIYVNHAPRRTDVEFDKARQLSSEPLTAQHQAIFEARLNTGLAVMVTFTEEKTTTSMDLEKEPISAEDTGEVSEKVLKHAHDADEAMKAFVGHEGEVIRLAEATNKRLLRKIDMNLMPVCGA